MGVDIDAVKGYSIEESKHGSYYRTLSVKEDDYQSTTWGHGAYYEVINELADVLKISKSLAEDLLPKIYDVYFNDDTCEVKDVNRWKEILDLVHIEVFNTLDGILAVEEHELSSRLQWVFEHWKKGYVVFINMYK